MLAGDFISDTSINKHCDKQCDIKCDIPCSCGILNASGDSLTVLASTVAISLSSKLCTKDLATLGAFLTALSDLILLNVQQKSRCEE